MDGVADGGERACTPFGGEPDAELVCLIARRLKAIPAPNWSCSPAIAITPSSPTGRRHAHIEVTKRRTAVDFAEQMRWLVDEAYPDAGKIRVVPDNLNIHQLGSLYETFDPSGARRIAKRLEFHHTPKHGSWLHPVLSQPKGWRR